MTKSVPSVEILGVHKRILEHDGPKRRDFRTQQDTA